MTDQKNEWLPLVDEDGNVKGKALRSECHNGKSMLFHPVVHLHILDTEGKLFLQKRVMTKDVQPGKWDTSVGGHVDPGEKIEEALVRETREEAGLVDFKYKLVKKYIWQSDVERELVHSFITITNKLPVTNPDEVETGRFWSFKEIEGNLSKGLFTPNFEYEFKAILPVSSLRQQFHW